MTKGVKIYAVLVDGAIAGFDYHREGQEPARNRVEMTPELMAKYEAVMAEQSALAQTAEAKQETIDARLKYDGADFSVVVKAR